MSNPLDPQVVERFRGDLLALLPDADRPGALALAVSGGADSMAMLAIAATAFPGRVQAATVDHRLRPESVGEAAMVADWCAGIGVPHAVLTLDLAPAPGGVQATARAARYQVLQRWAAGIGAIAILTAHQADDQAETLLMRLARGSGIAGLRGIPAVRTAGCGDGEVAVVRPLLGWRRAELRAIAAAAAIPFVDDPSNDDDRFERVRVRRMIADTPWLDAAAIARSAEALAEADRELQAMAEWLWRTRQRIDLPAGECAVDVAGLPRELRRRLARMAIARVRAAHAIERPAFTPATNIESLLDSIESGVAANQAGVLASADRGIWHFRREPPRRSR